MDTLKENDEINISAQTWNKLNNKASKSGYRDGISDGRDSNFQKSFDDGYREGFKNGFELGFYKGAISSNEETELQKVTRGNCVFCTDPKMEQNPIADIVEEQTKSTNKLLEKLHNTYNFVNLNLKNKLPE